MSPEKLVYMANQIGRFFAHQPEAQAVASTADHLKKFWDPRMRKAILDYVDHGGEGLQPLVRQAVLSLQAPPAS
jgi:formate dehydrogenase subunit delta